MQLDVLSPELRFLAIVSLRKELSLLPQKGALTPLEAISTACFSGNRIANQLRANTNRHVPDPADKDGRCCYPVLVKTQILQLVTS
ncbi:MAG: hypothetical protein CMM01_03450 [Rhodopirellula sp.]|nr:hypothetical protein [Rhodopirellula sp.]